MDHVSANKSLPVTERENISGARVFDGEDQGAGNRYRMQQLQQKDWNEQQIEVKNQQKNLERQTNALFDAQTLHVYDMLKETQSQHNKHRTENEMENDRINAILAQEKRDRECNQHQEWARQEKHELNFTLAHDFMTENQQTEVSMLANHRVKPYHFKGFTESQKDQVNLERAQQINEAAMMKQQEADENKLYAMQLEHQRRQQVLNDRRMKRDLRGVQVEHKEFQETVQQPDHKAKWVDPYHERDIDHKHEGNKYVLGDTKWEERNTYSQSIAHNDANKLHAETFTQYKYGRQQRGQHA